MAKEAKDVVGEAFPTEEPEKDSGEREPGSAERRAALQDRMKDSETIAGEAPEASRLSDYLGALLALSPTRKEVIDTTIGKAEAQFAFAIVIHDEGDPRAYEDLGEVPIFWQVVQRKLAAATDDVPWIVGRLIRPKRSYDLQPPDTEEMKRAQVALRMWLEF